MVKVT